MTSGFQRSQASVFLFRTLFECPQSSNLGHCCSFFPADFRGIVRHTSASLAFRVLLERSVSASERGRQRGILFNNLQEIRRDLHFAWLRLALTLPTCVLLRSEIPTLQWNSASLHFSTRPLRHRRSRPVRLRIRGFPLRCGTKIVASPTAESHGIRRFPIPVLLSVCRQPVVAQSGAPAG